MGDNNQEGKMKFLLLVTSNPFSKDYNTVFKLAKELKNHGEVVIFFSGNGAYYTLRKECKELHDLGIRMLYCAHSVHQRGIEKPLDFFESSSTYNLSRMLPEFDKIIAFN